MAKQRTLGKFWEMPKGVAPPPLQQSDLKNAFKPKSQDAQHEAGSSKQDRAPAVVKEATKPASKVTTTSKKRPVVESDDDDAEPTKTSASSESPAKKKAKIDPSNSIEEMADEAQEIAAEQLKDIKKVTEKGSSEIKPVIKKGPTAPHSIFSKPSPAPKAGPSSSSNTFKDKTKKRKIDPDDDENEMDVEGTPADDHESAGKSSQHEDDDAEEDEVNEEAESKEMNEAAMKLASTYAGTLDSVSKKGKQWKEGEPVPYSALTDCFDEIDKTAKRLLISNYLTQFLLKVAMNPGENGDDLRKVVYLCINRLCPDYMGVELGIGESLIIKAIAQSTGRKPADIKADLKKVGDLGLVAEQSKGKQRTLAKPKPLTVDFVFKTLEAIAKTSGKDSQARKVGLIQKILISCQGSETRFIIRSLEGKLRIGLAEKTLVTALAHAIVLKDVGKKKAQQAELAEKLARGNEIVKQVYSELPNYDIVVPALLAHGIDGLRAAAKLTPGVPLKPMLAKPTKAIGEVLDRFEGKDFTCEYKYDGERAQIHRMENGEIVVFSRNSENMSAKYPDLVESAPKWHGEDVKSFVLDSEAVAYDLQTKKLLPFQDLSRRKRKDVRTEDITVRVHVFAFDLLYLNGESLLTKELKDRRALLKKHFNLVEGEFGFAKSSDGNSSDQIAEFLDESIKDGCEGLMVKRLTTEDATYEPSRRSINWLKLKKDYLSGVGDSMDLCVVGGYFGKGKRTNVYGALLLACYDPDSDQWQTATKIGTGFSEQQLIELFQLLNPLELTTKRGDIIADPSKPPDVWFEPKIVMEVLCADLSLSPIYKAGQGLQGDKGISLRFPRFIRLRDDKDADDITTGEQISEFYENQALAGGKTGGGGGGDDW